MPSNSSLIEIPSKIKSIYVELPDYQFHHGITDKAFEYFVGREKIRERLKTILLHSGKKSGGAYLVTGYRGMGKTTLVESVLKDINDEEIKINQIPKFIKINISLSQDEIKDFDVLKLLAIQFKRAWVDNAKFFNINEAYYNNEEITSIGQALTRLEDNLNAIVKRNQAYEIDEQITPQNKTFGSKELMRYESLPKEIEKELIYILDCIDRYRNAYDKDKNGKLITIPQFVVIIDELDKIEPNYFYDFEYNHKNNVEIPTQNQLDNLFGINKVRRRQEVIARLLANLKSFLNVAKAKFIFIGGREMYDATLADIADRDSFYSSIFHNIIYVNSFFKDKLGNSRSGITRLTEAYLCKLLIPQDYILNYLNCEEKEIQKRQDIYNLNTCYHWFIDCASQNGYSYANARIELINDTHKKMSIYKLIFFFQNLIIFLTFRGNGTPKKIVALIESYIIRLSKEKFEEIRQFNNNVISYRLKNYSVGESRLFLRFSYNQQYEIGLTANIYRPYAIIHSRYLKALGDKLLYSTAYIMDYILKYHPHAFSWRNLELIPEIILVNKDPNLRYFLSDILNFLSGMYVRETTTGMFQYKFYNKQANEIKLLTKISESASAAFNFTLDESLHIIRYYRRKLDQLKKVHPNHNNEYIHSIGFVEGILGDLYYFEKEYDEAIIHYTDSIQILRRLAQHKPQEMTKHQCVIYVKNKLLLGLCLEKIKAFDSAYSIYRGLILNIPILLDSVLNLPNLDMQEGTYLGKDDEWDKPIRRMQLFLKPHIALLDLIEKQRMDGITYANLSRNHKEVYEFLVDSHQFKIKSEITIGKGKVSSKKKMDEVRVSLLLSDYYANVGSLLFFKNRNFPELHKLLNEFKLTNDRTSNLFEFIEDRKGIGNYTPSLSSFTYYYIGLRELVNSYDSKFEAIKKLSSSNVSEYKADDIAFKKAIYLLYPECSGIINNSILFTFGNLLSRTGDSLLSCLSEKSFEKYILKEEVLDLFKNNNLNEILKDDLNITQKAMKLIEHQDEKRCSLGVFCDINYVLTLYRLASLFYIKASRTYSYAFQYKKLLFVLKDYLVCVREEQLYKGFSSIEKNSEEEKKRKIQQRIFEICENIAVEVINASTWVSDVANRPQILKYREIFRYNDKKYNKEETKLIYTNLSNSPEIREIIVLVEEIKLKVLRIFKIHPKNLSDIKSHITPYDLINNKFSRLQELRFQCELNYYKLQYRGLDILLKSPIIVDLHYLNILQNDTEMKRIAKSIRKIIKDKNVPFDLYSNLDKNVPLIKAKNIQEHLESRISIIKEKIKTRNLNLEKLLVKDIPEFFVLTDPSNKLLNEVNGEKLKEVKEIICDSVFSLFEVIRTLNLFGINYISNYSFLANVHFKLANWCEMSQNLDLIIEMLKKQDNEQFNNNYTSISSRELLKLTIGEEDIYYLEANYHNELAIQYYYSALQVHNGGNAYKSINQSMSFLEDDFNDNLTHFSAASERFRINTGLVNKKLSDLKNKIKNSNIYDYKSYLDE